MAASSAEIRRPRVLIGVSGSVAAIKLQQLVRELAKFAEVKVVTTPSAEHFFNKHDIDCVVYTDNHEWNQWSKIGDPVLHIELRRWADIFLIAPLSANTLAKLAHGINDNLLTCVARAWDFNRKFLVAPAMNTFMWEHPHTAEHLKKLTKLGIQIIPPKSKTLACGDTGMGAMAEVDVIVATVKAIMQSGQSSVPQSKL